MINKKNIMYYLFSIFAVIFILLPQITIFPILLSYYLLYAICCSALYILLKKTSHFTSYIIFEFIIVLSWVCISWVSLSIFKNTYPSHEIKYALLAKSISFTMIFRVCSYLFFVFVFKKFIKYQSVLLKIIAFCAIAPCLYFFTSLLIMHFVFLFGGKSIYRTSVPASKLEEINVSRCSDQLYESANIVFQEKMFVVSKVETTIEDSTKRFKTIQAISFLRNDTKDLDEIDVSYPFEVSNCFYKNKEKYYILEGKTQEFAIKLPDLDFSSKSILTIQHILTESLKNKNHVLFRKYLFNRNFNHNVITTKVVELDEIDFFKHIYEKEGDVVLGKALSIAKKDSLIAKFALSKQLSVDQLNIALISKIKKGTAEEVKLLLKRGATFFVDNRDQELPIMGVTRNKVNFKEIIDIYLSRGGDINIKSIGGESILLLANSVHQIDYLLKKGANINIKNDKGMNLLLKLAQFHNNKDRFLMMKYLVDKGIDRYQRNSTGDTAYQVLLKYDSKCKSRRINQCEILDSLR